ncbi:MULTISPECIES: Rsd/AlgQ family anti-sigma factor [Shewanella]|uniref:Rsd/AlgQ family anti-sigma factor n=1 Tax=Shewanella fidelis TaxID=173509 RepID=A0AAW8NR48_9GAMM|nr:MULTISPECIES: Rsd/AlgQ family anti-sigma factor [Shewanella]MDR8525382.1 Rsd/AlgQ family anti-sigma factor [Shewanella fidelis]MDW4813582.1 Rsd/AlgQ family anti-sigma factor [Shewanella fidelis]MDW4817760.1 Rsd/AlgQ family anti-sigma factor [Shewanella fidelis]MDW4821827.1 Rsd/AlgQ family anti-sigma factor [Shewanella fidelis]MDW4825910.1 Rsd/AlgQ family anti-sigma factor [Shewanella fidelis]
MLRKLEKAEQKWGGSNTLIDQWLNNRRNLLINYCQIAGLPPYEVSDKPLPEFESVKQFCDQLMDYVSEGHFEIYNQVVAACEKNGHSSQALAQQLVPQISETTDTALDFNDKYTEAEDEKVLFHLDKDLSSLGHAMETRFALEDKLLEVLHSKHS